MKKTWKKLKKRLPSRPVILLSGLIVLLVFIIYLILFPISIPLSTSSSTPKTTEIINPPEAIYIKQHHMSFKELESYFIYLAKTKSPEYAYAVLGQADMPQFTDVHIIAHDIGNVLFQERGANGIKICNMDFGNGCAHSIVIGLFIQKGTKALKEITQACNEASGGTLGYTMCLHGVGHGVLAYTDYDMPKAINLCKEVKNYNPDPKAYVECVGGVTMEMVSGLHDRRVWEMQSPKYIETGDPLAPCTLSFMPKEANSICYTYITPLLLNRAGTSLSQKNPGAIAKAFSFCDRIPLDEKSNRNSCFGGFGKEFTSMAHDRDIRNMNSLTDEQSKEIDAWCLLANNIDGVNSCISYAVNSAYWGGRWAESTPKRICDQIDDNNDYQKSCYQSLISIIFYYQKDKAWRTIFCTTVPKAYVKECQSAVSRA